MKVTTQGYLRHPTVHRNQLVFVCEDDLWQVSLKGGRAERLTNSRGEISDPCFSPDGRWLALCGREEGEADVYVFPAGGGQLQRLTYLNSPMRVVGWTRDSKYVIFCSTHRAIHRYADAALYRVPLGGGPVSLLPFGPASFMSYAPQGKGVVIGRHTTSNSRWKRYRGGTVGEIWMDREGQGDFRRLFTELGGNPVCPLWLGERLYFVSDHAGVGNLYSAFADGSDLRQETFQSKFYVRQPSTDGRWLVYHVGGDLWMFDPEKQTEARIPIQLHSPKVQLQRKFFYGDEYLEQAVLHPQGHGLAMVARGKLFTMPLWEQAVTQYGARDGVRYRLVQWLSDERLIAISDEEGGQEKLAVFRPNPQIRAELLIDLPPGRVQTLLTAPQKNQIAFTNSRMELYLIDLDAEVLTKIDESNIRELSDLAFSPDGRWLAYTKNLDLQRTAIFLAHLEHKQVHQVTHPVRYDFGPTFDPEGRYLYFLSSRTYNPLSDTVQMAFTFTRSIKPYLLTLRRDGQNPFQLQPHPPGQSKEEEGAKTSSLLENLVPPAPSSPAGAAPAPEAKEATIKEVVIDLEGIQQRVIEFPVGASLYEQILALPNKVLFTEAPLLGDLEERLPDEDQLPQALLWAYDFERQEPEQIAENVTGMQLSKSGKTLLYQSGTRLRALEAGSVPADEREVGAAPGRKTGWLDLSRVRISVDYTAEWPQMFREAWNLQKEFFWMDQIPGLDWQEVYERYAPLLPRLGSRSELSDLIWEMQGELGTSHAYEFGGDYPYAPEYSIGKLGADLEYEPRRKAYRIHKIYRGDVWKKDEHSPLCEPGVLVQEGDFLLAINGVPLEAQTPPGKLLTHWAGQEVWLTVKASEKRAQAREVLVKTLFGEERARYRDWVEGNLTRVREASGGRLGYLHIPDMEAWGIAEFHRAFLTQTEAQGLIVDVRYNAGGMVSPLILEKLSHRHLGYDVPRWGAPESYPYHTLRGYLLLLCNEFTGSDGDMFCYSFRALGLGAIVGKRTWGGVVGVDGRYRLVDGTLTTQPQYSIWFHHGGWSVENYGVVPDLEVEISPQDYAAGRDSQLEQSIQVLLKMLEEKPLPEVHLTKPVWRERPL